MPDRLCCLCVWCKQFKSKSTKIEEEKYKGALVLFKCTNIVGPKDVASVTKTT